MANENYTALRTEGANLMGGGGKSFQSLAAETKKRGYLEFCYDL